MQDQEKKFLRANYCMHCGKKKKKTKELIFDQHGVANKSF